jgi:hypothetical protein
MAGVRKRKLHNSVTIAALQQDKGGTVDYQLANAGCSRSGEFSALLRSIQCLDKLSL